MKWRDWLVDYSRGDNLVLFWRLFEWRSHTRHKWLRDIQSLLLGRIAHRHGGYIGVETKFDGRPRLPHGCMAFLSPGLRALGEIAASIRM